MLSRPLYHLARDDTCASTSGSGKQFWRCWRYWHGRASSWSSYRQVCLSPCARAAYAQPCFHRQLHRDRSAATPPRPSVPSPVHRMVSLALLLLLLRLPCSTPEAKQASTTSSRLPLRRESSQSSPKRVLARSAPLLQIFECTPDGQPARCFEDDCAGAWKSLRTRHCRDCGVCQ